MLWQPMNKILLIAAIIMSMATYASPPCRISFSVHDAPEDVENRLLKEITIYLAENDDLLSINIYAPKEYKAMRYHDLTLTLKNNGKKALITRVEPYHRDNSRVMNGFRIDKGLLKDTIIDMTYSFVEACNGQEVFSKSFKFNLNSAITNQTMAALPPRTH